MGQTCTVTPTGARPVAGAVLVLGKVPKKGGASGGASGSDAEYEMVFNDDDKNDDEVKEETNV